MSQMRSEQSVTRRSEPLESKRRKSGGLGVWSILGGAALVIMAAAVLTSLPDIKRYIKISTM